MAVKKSKRIQAKGKSRTIAHNTIPKRTKVEVSRNRCRSCGCSIAEGENWCSECLCEDDCDYLNG